MEWAGLSTRTLASRSPGGWRSEVRCPGLSSCWAPWPCLPWGPHLTLQPPPHDLMASRQPLLTPSRWESCSQWILGGHSICPCCWGRGARHGQPGLGGTRGRSQVGRAPVGLLSTGRPLLSSGGWERVFLCGGGQRCSSLLATTWGHVQCPAMGVLEPAGTVAAVSLGLPREGGEVSLPCGSHAAQLAAPALRLKSHETPRAGGRGQAAGDLRPERQGGRPWRTSLGPLSAPAVQTWSCPGHWQQKPAQTKLARRRPALSPRDQQKAAGQKASRCKGSAPAKCQGNLVSHHSPKQEGKKTKPHQRRPRSPHFHPGGSGANALTGLVKGGCGGTLTPVASSRHPYNAQPGLPPPCGSNEEPLALPQQSLSRPGEAHRGLGATRPSPWWWREASGLRDSSSRAACPSP